MASRPYRVVLDANVWVAERLLHSSLGAALLYSLRSTGSLIVLPEVVEEEVLRVIAREGAEAVRSIENGFLTVQALTGHRPEFDLPKWEEFRAVSVDRFKELDAILHRIPLTVAHCRSALRRVIDHTPPNETSEQFRDSLVWEALLEIAPTNDVFLVTRDKRFYEEGKYPKGLAITLRSEATAVGCAAAAFESLDAFLPAIQDRVPPPDYAKLAAAITLATADDLTSYASQRALIVGDLLSHNVDAYLTERADVLALAFMLLFSLDESTIAQKPELAGASLRAAGNCSFNLTTQNASDVKIDQIQCVDADGSPIPGTGAHYVRVESAIFGPREIPFKVRRKLDSEGA